MSAPGFIPKAGSGPANVTLAQGNGSIFASLPFAIGALTVILDDAVNGASVSNSGGSCQNCSFTGTAAENLEIDMADFECPINFIAATLNGNAIALTNCAQLPALVNGIASYTVSGATSSDTIALAEGTNTLPIALDVSGLSGSPIAATDFVGATGFSSNAAISHNLSGQAMPVQALQDYLAAVVIATIGSGSSPGTIDISGGTNGQIPNPIDGGSIGGTANAANQFGNQDYILLHFGAGTIAKCFGWNGDPPDPNLPAHDYVDLGTPSGDAATDAATMATAINANTVTLGWVATSVGTTFSCTQTGTIFRPYSGGDFSTMFTAIAAGFSSDWAVTYNAPA